VPAHPALLRQLDLTTAILRKVARRGATRSGLQVPVSAFDIVRFLARIDKPGFKVCQHLFSLRASLRRSALVPFDWRRACSARLQSTSSSRTMPLVRAPSPHGLPVGLPRPSAVRGRLGLSQDRLGCKLVGTISQILPLKRVGRTH